MIESTLLSSVGSTKLVHRRQSKSVCLVSIDGLAACRLASKCVPSCVAERPEERCPWIGQEHSPPAPCDEISDDDLVPPNMISCVP